MVLVWCWIGGVVGGLFVGLPVNVMACGGMESMACNRLTMLPMVVLGMAAGLAFGWYSLAKDGRDD